MFVGYRVKEIPALSKPTEVAAGISVDKEYYTADGPTRAVELVTAPFYYDGAALPHPDTRSPESLLSGFIGRMGRKLPDVTIPGYFERLRTTTRSWIERRGIERVDSEESFEFEEWLRTRHYTEKRKAELRKIHEEIVDLLERNDEGELKNFKVKLFCKDENYVDFKLNRGIYAREDVAKVFFGPACAKIEEILYQQPEFIKHVPVKDRGDYIFKRLYEDGARYVATDYSSYECHFDKARMENCEFVLYEHVLSSTARGKVILDIMAEVLQGDNRVYSRFFKGTVKARRMSGEMTTSLGNGFGNLMMMTDVCLSLGIDWDDIIGVVEGDDGLFRFTGVTPTKADFNACGCDIKLDTYLRISDASFCGLLFDEVDRQVIKDPYDIICSIGVLSKQYSNARRGKQLALLRAKALSTLYQYPGCPVIAEMSKHILRQTKHIDLRNVIEKNLSYDQFDRERYFEALKNHQYNADIKIGMGTRLLFSELYGMTVETQLRLEEYFRTAMTLEPFKDDFIDHVMSTHTTMSRWQNYFEIYSMDESTVPNHHHVIFPFEQIVLEKFPP